uniref:LisH domain-containing protein C16orf63 homolog n=1 Tax=Caligus rogercresseyi TaxID=217165 RepID=C1BQI6_CALRO|nr:LisH domain-containing protein C16orf63 homolog [Caligus rogercresseyi]
MSESETDLRDALRQSLEERGVLPGIKSQLRLEILKSLKSPEASKGPQPQYESEDNFLLNELIKEYFSWNGYLHASKVLSEESGHPSADLSRTQLEEALTLQSGPNGRKVPLLYSLLDRIKK